MTYVSPTGRRRPRPHEVDAQAQQAAEALAQVLVPETKHDRRARRAMAGFARLVYRTIRRHARRIDELETKLQVFEDALAELRTLPTNQQELREL